MNKKYELLANDTKQWDNPKRIGGKAYPIEIEE